MTIAETKLLAELADQLQIAAQLAPRALANLAEASPGFPASTPGAAPSSGRAEIDDAGVVPYTAVERVALHSDPAKWADARVRSLIEGLRVPVAELFSACKAWSYDREQTALDLNDVAHKWCTSCLRVERVEPRSPRYSQLCRWCGDFIAAEGRHPSADLLLAHHAGQRITRRMIIADRRASVPKKPAKRKR